MNKPAFSALTGRNALLMALPPLVDLGAVLPVLWGMLVALYLINAVAWALESAAARRRHRSMTLSSTTP